MPTRRWQRDLDTDPGSEIATRERARTTAETPQPIDLAEFVRATFDGAIGDEPLPFATQDAAAAAVEQGIAQRAKRPLNSSERTKVLIAVACEWNGRVAAQEAEDRIRRHEWLAEFQHGAA